MYLCFCFHLLPKCWVAVSLKAGLAVMAFSQACEISQELAIWITFLIRERMEVTGQDSVIGFV